MLETPCCSKIANRLESCICPGDTLARMGGDEFTAVFAHFQDPGEAVAKVREMLFALRRPYQVEGKELFATASAGLSFFPYDGADPATLLRHADAAMYTAKHLGRNDVHCYSADLTAGASERLQLETDLRRALERGEFRLYYEPQIDVSNQLAGLEVLIVWEHPHRGRISPGDFIPIAEETGLIVPIGEWVLREAGLRAARWNLTFPVAVNVSAVQLSRPDFAGTITRILGETGLRKDALELELTESAIMHSVEQAAALMAELRRLGVRIAIDDFGTGYSSLNYLRNLPADALKVDRSFLLDSANRSDTLPLMSAIVALAHTLRLSVTAEGVETSDQLQLIRSAGCDRAQGHLFGGALDESEVNELLSGASPLASMIQVLS